jgi:hypothetical protein
MVSHGEQDEERRVHASYNSYITADTAMIKSNVQTTTILHIKGHNLLLHLQM